ncbi:MAG: threonine/serine dehydratase [Alicyclobacillus sp.]|nr:threonine/serine dehydratase [Alicyclobacillus sp.]
MEWDDIVRAEQRIRGKVAKTPLVKAHRLSERLGQEVYLKCENLQVTGSFKARGATNFVQALATEGDEGRQLIGVTADRSVQGVITGSSGNHGQAVAYAAQQVGLPCVVVVPEDVIGVKEQAIRGFGAEVVRCGRTSSERIAKAEEIAEARGYVFVPPYDHPLVAAGQGTAGLEILQQRPDVRMVFVPVGGGGLISGVSTAVKSRLPGSQVVGAEPELANDTYLSLEAGKVVDIGVSTTVADGLRSNHPGQYTFPIVQKRVDRVTLVSEAAIWSALRDVLAEKLLAEPSGATSVAAAVRAAAEGWLEGPAVCVISGGNAAAEVLVEALA